VYGGCEMREIKFRAWVKDWSERISEDEPNKINGMYVVRGLWQSNTFKQYVDLNGYKYGDVELWGFKSSVQTDKVYLMQYTGLKDKNGKEIYEGDVVDNGNGPVEVFYNENYQAFWVRFQSEKTEEQFYSSLSDYDDEFEIIGNIYENLELIEVVKNE
jgi:uncharacterized phage protein (TIGR01671 family)